MFFSLFWFTLHLEGAPSCVTSMYRQTWFGGLPTLIVAGAPGEGGTVAAGRGARGGQMDLNGFST